MRRWALNVFRLGLKEVMSLSRDVVMVVLIIYVFTVAVYAMATGIKTEVSNASVAIVDADRSTISSRIRDALQPPYFRAPRDIDRSEVDELMDKGVYTFVLEIPPRFEADLLANRRPSIQINVDATAVSNAAVGTAYIQEIIARETESFLHEHGESQAVPIEPVIRALFNQNLEAVRFNASMDIINNVTMLGIILVGAAVMREREHGTIEHLLVMPVRPSEIAVAKIWSNGLVILLAAGLSLHVVVQFVLQIPIIGSVELFLAGTAVYLFAVTSLGILLATIANSMPQFALLAIPVFVIMFLLSGTFTPFESMPPLLQDIMYAVPSTHFVKFAQSILYRGAGLDVVWMDLTIMAGLGAAFLAAALSRFRTMLTRQS
ncbi:Inner membrane transport permease YhhJ [Ensifer sp. M14]|uniref:ABC transporter permease n=1 Tax=Sinorhizobium sp. M14 TaxID=430451 RepID=A0A142BPL1_9HYPH|nr:MULTISPECIES: ABC transporter permease [Sinorhizobium/Ensifer group]AMP35019.1 ABC transporter permease [Sinorhizobium sp. M14]RDL47997.1 Inner membrane transport permease YhhJ [Ensifer sp. M14]